MAVDDTRKQIAEAFIALVEKTPLDHIRVQDITERAGVSKATFYRLFKDKYDVMNWTYLGPTAALVAQLPDLSNWKEWTRITLLDARKDARFYKNISQYHGQNSFEEALWQYFDNNIRRGVCEMRGDSVLPPDIEFSIKAFSRVNAFTMIYWIQNNCEMPVNTLIDYVDGCMPDCLKVYFSRHD